MCVREVEGSRRSSKGRQRTTLSSIFPPQQVSNLPSYLTVVIEEASSDRHGAPDVDEVLHEELQQPAATPEVLCSSTCPRNWSQQA